jgi:hypothetical protein
MVGVVEVVVEVLVRQAHLKHAWAPSHWLTECGSLKTFTAGMGGPLMTWFNEAPEFHAI